jgi:hypothetical protein
MIQASPRLIDALARVDEAGGWLEPKWDPARPEGFAYSLAGTSDGISLIGDLEDLAQHNYLEHMFVDRISLCPHCGSHSLTVREICVECRASNIVPVETLLHFRCAFVGSASLFREEPAGRRCPKCNKLMHELGTDHGRPGDYFSCRACTATFQLPDIGALCLSCHSRFVAEEMKAIRYRDVYAYRITALGRAALKEGRLFEKGREALYDGDGRAYRRQALIGFIEDECKRRRTLGSPFGIIIVRDSAQSMKDIRLVLSEVDKLARWDDRNFVVVLPGANKARTRSTLKRIRGSRLIAEIVEGVDTDDIVSRLDVTARRHDDRH